MTSNVAPCTNPSLWMGDLDPYMDEGFIRSAFAQTGFTVNRVKFLNDKKTGLPAGYCFVDFGEVQLAKKAYQACSGRKMPGAPMKKFKLNFAFSGGWVNSTVPAPATVPTASSSPTDFSLHVSKLSLDVTDEQLYDYFSGRFKTVKTATVVRDGFVSRGYGFVRFHIESDMLEAMRLFNGAVGLGTNAIRVGRATPFVPKDHLKSAPYLANPPPQPSAYQQYYTTPQQQYAQLSTQYGSGYGGSYDQYKQSSNSNTKNVKTEAGDNSAGNTDEEDDDPLVDPEITIDIEKSNRLILERSEELYQALEESRWQVVDSVTMTYDDLCKV